VIAAIVFDFDGVLVDSVPIKTEAFTQLFKAYPERLDTIRQFHLSNGGLSRSEKIRYFYEHILHEALPRETLDSLCDRFRALVMEKVIQAPFITGARELLDRCFGRYPMYVISATPEEEITEIIKRRRMDSFFLRVVGSPTPKKAALREIVRETGLAPGEIVFIGDSINDLKAANDSGVCFIAVGMNGEAELSHDPCVIAQVSDLSQVYSLLTRSYSGLHGTKSEK
jgi:HAD superfamily hydrolase (TIGR01549 family)